MCFPPHPWKSLLLNGLSYDVMSTTATTTLPQNCSFHFFSLKLSVFQTFYSFKILFIYFRERGREERERNTNVWLPLACPILGTWPATQACALTGNQTGDPLVRRLALNPLSYTSQGKHFIILTIYWALPVSSWRFNISSHLNLRETPKVGAIMIIFKNRGQGQVW